METTCKSLAKKIIGPTLTSFVRRELNRLLAVKYKYPLSPYRRITDDDLNKFKPVLSVWRPSGEEPVFILNWLMTNWCNYRCSYCPQSHDRYQRIGKYTAHAFDNHTLEKWLEAFLQHFKQRRLSLSISGGEVMLDTKNMLPYLKKIVSMPTVESIRISTNASWKLDTYRDVDPTKIVLMCTYHPEQTSLEIFSGKIRQFINSGYKIGMVNFVMNRSNFKIYGEAKKVMSEIGVPLHPNPLWDSDGVYSEEDLLVLKKELPESDFKYRTQSESPYKKKCLYPAIAYEMNCFGEIQVGCHPHVFGSFFDNDLPPTFAGPVPCPEKSCVCLDKYSFLEEVNRNVHIDPLGVYSKILKNRLGIMTDSFINKI